MIRFTTACTCKRAMSALDNKADTFTRNEHLRFSSLPEGRKSAKIHANLGFI